MTFQSSSAIFLSLLQVLNPRCKHLVWPLSRSLAATWKIVLYFLFLRVLRCFSSPRSLSRGYFTYHGVPGHCSRWVPPFGHLRVSGYLLLTAAFRSLSRPSSAPSAKASTLCSSSLGQHCHACAMHGLFVCLRTFNCFFETIDRLLISLLVKS